MNGCPFRIENKTKSNNLVETEFTHPPKEFGSVQVKYFRVQELRSLVLLLRSSKIGAVPILMLPTFENGYLGLMPFKTVEESHPAIPSRRSQDSS